MSAAPTPAWSPPRRPAALVVGAVLSAVGFGVLATVVVVRGGVPLGFDTAVHHWSTAHRSRAATGAAITVTRTGTGVVAFGLAAVAGALGAGRRPAWVGALAGIVLLGSGDALRFGMSVAVRRPRPPQSDWAYAASGHAFPSGHTTTSALVAALFCVALGRRALSRRRRVVGRGVVVAWAVSVGVTRVYLGVHWPTDVLGGWLLALALGLAHGHLLARPLAPARPRRPAGRTAP